MQQQNLVPNDPELKDLLELFRKQIFLDLNCHHVGTIQTFDKTKQMATATINYEKTYFERNEETQTYDPVQVKYPILIDCPCLVTGGGGGAITFPIRKGDECIILFNDRDLDTWLQSGATTASNNTGRLHSFSDGMIIVGLRSMANVIDDYADDATEWFFGDNRISMDGDDITVTTPGMTATFRAAGGMFLTNAIGNFQFADDADVMFNTGTVVGRFGHSGKVKFENAVGDLVTALFNIISTATAAGFPLVVSPTDLAILQSFVP